MSNPSNVQEPYSETVRKKLHKRLWIAVDILSHTLLIAVVTGLAVAIEQGLFMFIWWVSPLDPVASPEVAAFHKGAQQLIMIIGLGGAVIHGIISAISQVVMEVQLARER